MYFCLILYAEENALNGLHIYRARSIYERAIGVDHRNISLWLKYTEMEMKNQQVNHARNLFDRAVQILPRVNQFWYKYVYMEEKLGNYAGMVHFLHAVIILAWWNVQSFCKTFYRSATSV